MIVDAELLILPYASADGRSLLDLLIAEFESSRWTEFFGAVGFLKSSGNFPDLLGAMRGFVQKDDRTTLRVTFGADTFSGGAKGSDLDALKDVLEALDGLDRAEVFLYHEPGRTFHPKLYVFSNVEAEQALIIVGSSNWSEGGLVQNIELNVLLRLDLSEDDELAGYTRLRDHFNEFWSEA